MKRKSARKPPEVEWSGGNVFADIGLKDADQHLAKATLVVRLASVIEKRKLTQRQAAKLLGIDQPKISALLRGQLAGFSTDRLLRFLVALGQNVDIVVRQKPRNQRVARIQVSAA